MKKALIYTRHHSSYHTKIHNAIKLGRTTNLPERNNTYKTGELESGNFDYGVYEVSSLIVNDLERTLQEEFQAFHIKLTGGDEFYDIEIVGKIEPFFIERNIKYKKLTKEEIDGLERIYRIKNAFKEKFLLPSHRKTSYKTKENRKRYYKKVLLSTSTTKQEEENQNKEPEENNTSYIWNTDRPYQNTAIEYAFRVLSVLCSVLYILLPTGAGKTYIVFSLLNRFTPSFIVMMSPRKIVNSQNSDDKYLQLLNKNNKKYLVFNYSSSSSPSSLCEFLRSPYPYKLLVCCTQSADKIQEKIVEYNITDITYWADEAHWGIEEWATNKECENKREFWLCDKKHIERRIFTSASPNKTLVKENPDIFGSLYEPISVSDLTDQKYLSPIEPYVYEEYTNNGDMMTNILDTMKKTDRRYGFSFHSNQSNAFSLFYLHYQIYKDRETDIQPFLLVADNFTEEREPRLKTIELPYDYRDIGTYENTSYSLGFVVAKYNMGYDFRRLDYSSISDPKLSYQDIIQSIGRGVRPDGLGEGGRNKEKKFILSLPVLFDENGEHKFHKVKEVLNYLVNDLEIPFDNFHFGSVKKGEEKEKEKKENQGKDYTGTEYVKSILYEILRNKHGHLTYETARKMVRGYKLTTKEEYYTLCETKEPRLPREPEREFNGKFTNWVDYLQMERKYYNVDDCKKMVATYVEQYPDLYKYKMDVYKMTVEICKLDDQFPPAGVWSDYYGKELVDIMGVKIKKKKYALL